MELTWWNQKTYNEICNYFNSGKRCAIENATGTGKTSVITSVIKDFVNNGNILVIAPREAILDQYNNPLYDIFHYDNIDYVTYSRIGKENKYNELNYTNLSLIVIDELHRTGAKTWLPAIQNIISMNPNAMVLGASATPKRLDQKLQEEDMIDEIFDGNRCGNFDLITCVKEGILPKPIYTSALYSLDEEEAKILSKITKVSNEEDKLNLYNDIKEARINWEESYNYNKIIRDFLNFEDISNRTTKILVFCKNISHIKEIRNNFDPIFEDMYKDYNLELLEYHSKTNEKDFIKFKDTDENGIIQILYTVDKFNEGIHIDKLDAIIMLRETESEIIYYQQLGRVLSLSGRETPIIIDLVNNFDKIKADDIWRDLLKEYNSINSYESDNKCNNKRDITVGFYNYSRDIIELYNSITKKIEKSVSYNYNGETGSLKYFAEKYNKDFKLLYYKIHTQKMTIREAIMTSDDIRNDTYTYKGFTGTTDEICKKFKRNLQLINYRLDHGKTIEEAMS